METLNTTLKLTALLTLFTFDTVYFFSSYVVLECNKFKGLRDLLFFREIQANGLLLKATHTVHTLS